MWTMQWTILVSPMYLNNHIGIELTFGTGARPQLHFDTIIRVTYTPHR